MAGTGTYMIPMGHLVRSRLDPDRLRAAATALVLRHDALRTRFEVADGAIFALVSSTPHFRFHVHLLTDPSLEAFRKWALPLIFDHVDPCDAGSLVRILVADLGDCWRFTIAAHHAITDGFSRGVMNRELLKIYAGEELPPPRSYYEFASAPKAILTPEVEEFVASLPNPARIVGDSIGREGPNDAGQIAELEFAGLAASLRLLGKSTGVSKFGILAAVYALGVRGYCGEAGVSSFFQSEGRAALGASNSVVGPFSHTLPLDLTVDPDQTFASLAAGLSERTKKAVALENEPLLDQVLAHGKAPSLSINMFPPASRVRAGTLDIGPREFLDRRTEFDLNLVWSEDENVMTARAFFDRAQLTAERAHLFLKFQGKILDAAMRDPQLRCHEILEIARQGDEVVLPQTCVDPAPTGRLHDRFFETVAQSPDMIAVITTKERITYHDLAQRVRQVVAALRRAGVGEGDRVAILAQRDPALAVAMLGVSASGASFAVIDATYPVERIRWMIKRLGGRFLIEAGASLPEDIRGEITVVAPDSGQMPDGAIESGPARSEACHMFTSGTTGQPKLITHPDTTLQRFVVWQANMLDLPQRICTVMMAGLGHDPTLRDVFLPLSHGGRIAIPTPCEMAQPKALRALLLRAECNVVRFSPTTARLLTAGMEKPEGLGTLRAIFWGGERLPHSEVRRWQGLTPAARQFNIFGTTETPQAFLYYEIEPSANWSRSIPLGRPLPWTGVRLVDDQGASIGSGEVGEIVAELADPVAGVQTKVALVGTKSACQHFTGDLGYHMPDGQIYFVGRRDGQVKINGFRVELGEIEATAEAVQGADRAYAVISEDRLLLFVEARMGGVTERSLRVVLARTLPGYMVPAQIVVIDRFPSRPNGKVDGPALLALLQSRAAITVAAAAAQLLGPAEQLLAEIFSKRTGRSGVGPDDTLEDLGADSLTTIEVRLELEKSGFDLPDDWQFMAISELAGFRKPQDRPVRLWDRLRASSRMEIFILIRALAIVAVVFFHSGYGWTGGASITLFVLAGFSFAQLQLVAIAQDDHSGRVWALIGRLFVPLVPMTLLYLGINEYRGLETHPASLFLYRNLVAVTDAVVVGKTVSDIGMSWLWFLHVYIQVFVLIGLLLSFPAPRRQLRTDAWRAIMAFFIMVEAVGLLAVVLFAEGPRDMVEAARLLHQSPVAILPFLVIGAIVALGKTKKRRIISLGTALLHFALVYVLYADHREVWWIFALAACAFFPHVTLPVAVARPVITVSAYSLMIYLAHPLAYLVFYKYFGGDGLIGVVGVFFQIGTGICLGIVARHVLGVIGVNRLSSLPVTFFPSRSPVPSLKEG